MEPSFSEYNSPILFFPKKSLPGSDEKRWRLLIDYRQIKKILLSDKFALARIDDILDQLGRAKYFFLFRLNVRFSPNKIGEKL